MLVLPNWLNSKTLLCLLSIAVCPGCVGVPHGDITGAAHAGGVAHCACESESGCGAATSDDGQCSGTTCSEACGSDESTAQPIPFHGAWSSAIAVCTMPLGMIGHVANFGLPVTSCAPPEIPPPGRFHPVPTRPVFAGNPLPY
jgi:hypothetical protein